MPVRTNPHVTGVPVSTNYRNLMIYIDGTNFLAALGRYLGVRLDAHRPHEAALDLARVVRTRIRDAEQGNVLVRAHWFGSYRGSGEYEKELRTLLHNRGFQGKLFPRPRDGSEKSVDIALAVQMMADASRGNFDTAWLIAGDLDFAELVREVKRHRTVVNGMFFPKHGLSEELRLSFDDFLPIQYVLDDVEAMGPKQELKRELAPL